MTIHNLHPSADPAWSASKGYHKPAAVERPHFYGHCRKCRHMNTCNLSTLPERGCANYEEIK